MDSLTVLKFSRPHFSPHKFEIGIPNLVPSLQLGITGAITPLASPPRTFNALFDFAIAGPLAGFAVSLALLVYGLNEMVPMDLVQQIELPVLPMSILRSSALGGNIIEYFLGKGVLGNGSSSVPALPMHPFAISGFLGLIANALALLPLGRKYNSVSHVMIYQDTLHYGL